LFEQAYSSATWTLPTIATLLTGMLPAEHGVRSISTVLSPTVTTIAESVREEGYRTVAITDGGFLGSGWGFSQGFDRYDTTPGPAWGAKDIATIVESASQWLDDNSHQPFFLLLHTYETHQPYTNRDGFADPFLDLLYEGPYADGARIDPRDMTGEEPSDVQRLVDLYDGEIRRLDHYVGQLLQSIREHGLLENTAILITSDHGEEFFEHGDFEHGFGKVFNENVRVPLIVKLPDAEDGRRISTPVSSSDIVPTLYDLARLRIPEPLSGSSLISLSAAGEDPGRHLLIHGVNSFPELNEERFRLDQGDLSLVFDRIRGQITFFNRKLDPDMSKALPMADTESPESLLETLNTVLGWTSTQNHHAVRIPDAVSSVTLEPGAAMNILGAWDGLQWIASDTGSRITLEPHQPHCLIVQVNEEHGRLTLEAAERTDEPYERIDLGMSSDSWRPLSDELPAHYQLFRSIRLNETEEPGLTEEQLQELRSLGYVR
jgi:hypothetical protein